MRKNLILAGLACSLLSGLACAQSKSGLYVGAGVGTAISDVAKDFGDAYYSRVTSSDDSDTAYKVYGGYMWGNWGVELGYYDLGKYKVEGGSVVKLADQFAVTSWTAAVVGSVPLNRNFSFTGKLGLAPAITKYTCLSSCTGIPNTDASSVGAVFSLGLAWHISDTLALRADWDALGGIKAIGYASANSKQEATYNYNLFSVSLEARF